MVGAENLGMLKSSRAIHRHGYKQAQLPVTGDERLFWQAE